MFASDADAVKLTELAAAELIRGGLSLALEHELTPEAAEVYQRLGTAHEVTGDYGGAREALGTAIGLCKPCQAGALEQVCVAGLQRVDGSGTRSGGSRSSSCDFPGTVPGNSQVGGQTAVCVPGTDATRR